MKSSKRTIRFLSLLLAVAMFCGLVACSRKKADETTSAVPVRVYTLNGTTGFGIARLWDLAAQNAFAGETYEISVKTDAATEVIPALITGDVDIAMLSTNAAALACNKTDGGVQILAINTLGCLYLLTNDGSEIRSWNDLHGKTVHVPAQNPAVLFSYLCEQNGLVPGTDLTIDSESYVAPAALKDRFALGATVKGKPGSDEVSIVVLPEPMATLARATANKNGVTVRTAMDLTEEWNKLPGKAGTLVQGCAVVRKAFADAHPEVIVDFLNAYRDSIAYLNESPAEAAQLIAKYEIFANAAVAESAIPKCNVTYLDGDVMKAAMQTYLGILYDVNPSSIGGILPVDGFYYTKK